MSKKDLDRIEAELKAGRKKWAQLTKEERVAIVQRRENRDFARSFFAPMILIFLALLLSTGYSQPESDQVKLLKAYDKTERRLIRAHQQTCDSIRVSNFEKIQFLHKNRAFLHQMAVDKDARIIRELSRDMLHQADSIAAATDSLINIEKEKLDQALRQHRNSQAR